MATTVTVSSKVQNLVPDALLAAKQINVIAVKDGQ
jgi:hypothetical protein